jgi:signal transduction histidine kinase
MAAATTTKTLPRPPFLQRLTSHQWSTIDVVIAALFLAGAVGSLFHDLSIEPSTPFRSWLVLAPLVVLATVPVAVRRRAPVFALVCTCGASAVLAMLGHSVAPVPVIALPLYTVTVAYSRRTSIVALALVEASALVALGVAALVRPVTGDITFTLFLAAATWFAGDSVRTRRAYQASLAEQAEERQRQEMDRAGRAIVEERLGIARELHDVVAHHISMIAVQAETARLTTAGMPAAGAQRLSSIGDTARAALTEMRRLLGVLREDTETDVTDLQPQPGLRQLNELLDAARDAAGTGARLILHGAPIALDPGVELAAYRIVQEALTNARRHAPGAAVDVELHYGDDRLRLLIRDNGPGPFATRPDQAVPEAGHGLLGMRERAAAVGGELSTGQAAGGGFLVSASLPGKGEAE